MTGTLARHSLTPASTRVSAGLPCSGLGSHECPDLALILRGRIGGTPFGRAKVVGSEGFFAASGRDSGRMS